ncbi:MAG: hypothetical protein Q9222_000525 [Ikaeria aurantiellina]
MTSEGTFKKLQRDVSSALVDTTRTASRISSEDLAFQRSINPEVSRRLDGQSKRLLSLVRNLNKTASAGTDAVPPRLKNVESVDDEWRGIVDIVDNLLEKADACLDEFTGVIKKLTPSRPSDPVTMSTKRPLAKHEYRNQNLPKPQRLFRNVPRNEETTPFRPLLQTKPNGLTSLEDSLVMTPSQEGSLQYKHPYHDEIVQSNFPDAAYVQSDPLPYSPFESTTATWVDTPEAVQDMLRDLRRAKEIAVDVEHHDLHTYIGLVSLLQISTREKDWIVDTLVPWREDLQILNEVFTDPRIIKVLHGSTSDILWLQRDLGLYIVGLFDTYHASRLLRYQKRGLAYLLQRFTKYEPDKRYQMADWRMRPLPEQMFDYARSDTHFLLYIYDNLRNELLTNSDLTSPDGNLIDSVRDSSKAEALQRYERPFYDAATGMGLNGWYNILSRSLGLFSREQFAVFRAVHQWRDQIARQKDESLMHILSNHALQAIAREIPTELPVLLGYCHPISSTMKKSAAELIEVIKETKANGANGPEPKDLMSPPILGHSMNLAAAPNSMISRTNIISATNHPMLPTNTVKPSLATFSSSHFWGSTISGDKEGKQEDFPLAPVEQPHLALPLPPLTAEVFVSQTSKESPLQTPATIDPGARADHQYTKKRKPRDEDDVFVVKQVGGSKKRKTVELQDEMEAVGLQEDEPMTNGTVEPQPEKIEISPRDEIQDEQKANEKAQRRQERKMQKKLKKERKKQEELQRTNGHADGELNNGESAAFDYEAAPSVLHARQEPDRPGGPKRGFDPYTKSLNAPKGMRKVQKEGPGRSMTYKH